MLQRNPKSCWDGGSFSTRLMTIGLPENKFSDWTRDLQRLIDQKRCSFGELESLAGRLGHASYAIPLTRHFLERIERTLARPDTRKKTIIALHEDVVADLKLWVAFLIKANKGVSINLVTIRRPTRSAGPTHVRSGLAVTASQRGKDGESKYPSEASYADTAG